MGAVVSATAAVVPLSEIGPRRDQDATDRLDGYRIGRDEGFQAGYADGLERAQQSMAEMLDGLHAAVVQVEHEREVAEDRISALAIALAAELAEAIVGGDLSLLETGEDVLSRAFGLRRAGERVRIRLHPQHPAHDLPERHGVELAADPELGPNEAFAEIGEGLADLSIDAAIERVRSALA
jgi:flagellar biosynthesis/type III secretory pathway protein FliH